MRIYYIFMIKSDIYDITHDKQENLYQILEKIYLMSNNELKLGYKMFDKVASSINKEDVDNKLKELNIDNINYIKFKNIHIINDYYTKENTKLVINASHIKVKSNANFPTFFKDIKNYSNLFVCDFINMDYFYLKDAFIDACIKV